MPSFEDCIRSAQAQGYLGMSDEEADALIRRYNEHRDNLRASGAADADAGATAALAKEAEQIAGIKRATAQGGVEARNALAQYFQEFRDIKGRPDVFNAAMNTIENFGFGAGRVGATQLATAKFNLAISGMYDMLYKFRRSAGLGVRMNKPAGKDVVREILGESSGSSEAKAFADATSEVFKDLRQQFNKAARYEAIGKLDYGYLPQNHNATAMLNAGYETWRDKFKQWFRPDRDLPPEQLEKAFKSTWDRVVTNGWSDREPQARPFGIGALAGQRSDHRFWHPRDAESWLQWNEQFGSGDPIVAMLQHIRGMTRDIAMMDVFGPNPRATVEWMKQVVRSQVAKQQIGEQSLYTPRFFHINPESRLPDRIQEVYDYARGPEVISRKIATFVGSTRNVLTSAQLGGTSLLAATQDPFIDMAARHLTGLPMTKAIYDIASALSKEKREIAVRAGLGWDDFMHITGEEARYAGALNGSEATRWLADRVVHWNGLEPITQSRRHGFGIDFMGAMADHRNVGFDDLPQALRRTMNDYGLTAKDWDKLRAVEPHRPQDDSAGILRPSDVAETSPKLAERYLGMILGQTERDVPTSTIRSKSYVTGMLKRGTVLGEIAASALQYKNFSFSFTAMQLQALQMELAAGSASGAAATGAAMVARGAGYAVSLAVPLTLAGALAIELRAIAGGKDPQPMDNWKFWIAALQTGGGFGVMGDFLFSDYSRYGQSMMTVAAGPLIGMIADVGDTALRLSHKGIEGQKTNPGREATRMLGRYTPFSTLPYTRLAYRRMFLDQLQYLTDPEAHNYWRQAEQKLHRETGQGYWWKAGETAPYRFPELPSSPVH